MGGEYSYEELWTDLPLDTADSGKGARECVALQARGLETPRGGMIIKIGGWCQGILKNEYGVAVERWQWTKG